MKWFVASLFILFVQTIFAQKIDFKEFIPNGYSILDTSSGDLNRDKITDYLIILKNELESTVSDTTRPLLIVHGHKDGTFKLAEQNEKIVLCFGCGGVFGDPYSGITIKNNSFSIQHYGGSAWRWTRTIAFQYNKKLKKYILLKDTGVSFHTSEPNKKEYHTYKKNDWNKADFKTYSTDW